MGNHFNNNRLYRSPLRFQTHSKRRIKSSPYHSETFIFEVSRLAIQNGKPLIFFQINEKLSILKTTI